MIFEALLLLSVDLQFLAAGLALRLIPLSRHKPAWILISIALFLMGTRRLMGMLGLLQDWPAFLIAMEGVALFISVLMFSATLLIKNYFEENNRTEARQRHLSEIIHNTSDIIISFRGDGTISYANPQALRQMGCKADADSTGEGLTLESVFSPESLLLLHRQALPEVKSGSIWRGQLQLHHLFKDHTIHLSVVLLAHPADPASNGKRPSFSLIARDISESVEFERRLEELSRSRERLLGVVAHDLRGPIGNSIALIRLMREDFDKCSREELRHDLKQLEQTLSRNFSMMEKLLRWTRSQSLAEDVHTQELSLMELVQGLLPEIEENAALKHLTINCDIAADTSVIGDIEVIETVIRNLVANACKFSPESDSVRISARERGSVVEILVEDHGSGIPSKLQRKIDKGIPVKSESGTIGEHGNGLGLSLCHALVASMKKALPQCDFGIVHSGPQGTRMHLVLPAAHPHGAHA
jgi:PAS domain S-box-containing protein